VAGQYGIEARVAGYNSFRALAASLGLVLVLRVSRCLRQGEVLPARPGRTRDWCSKDHIIWSHSWGQTPPSDLAGYTWGPDRIHHVKLVGQWPPGVTVIISGKTHGRGQVREGDRVFRNWRNKRLIASVADCISKPTY